MKAWAWFPFDQTVFTVLASGITAAVVTTFILHHPLRNSPIVTGTAARIPKGLDFRSKKR